MPTSVRTWKDWRDRTTWEVSLVGDGDPEAVAARNGRPLPRPAILFRGRLSGRTVLVAAPYPPGEKSVDRLADYELQWYLDEALTRYRELGAPSET